MNIRSLFVSWFSVLVGSPLVCLMAQENSLSVSFENDIRPIFESNCLRCHGPQDPEGGYRMDRRDLALDYIEPGDAESSELFQLLITDDEGELMPPPDEGGPLDDSDIELIRVWIDEGARWPTGIELRDPDQADSENVTDDRLSEENGGSGQTSDEQQEPGSKRAAAADQPAPNLFRALGLLHPASVHLPVGLLMAAGLFALLSLRGSFVMGDCAFYCLWLGALTSIVACLTGWWFVLTEFPKEYVSSFDDLLNMQHKVFWHRTSALIAAVLALILALFAASARNRDPDDGVSWKLGLIILAIGVGFVGHQGGKLTWKENHYRELYEVLGHYFPGMFGKQEGVDAADRPAVNQADKLGADKLETDEPANSNAQPTDSGPVDSKLPAELAVPEEPEDDEDVKAFSAAMLEEQG